MIVFKTFLKVLNKCKGIIIFETALLIFFGGYNIETNDVSINFVSSNPNVLIINRDKKEGITKNLINYIENNSNIVDIDENLIDDALFYRDVNYIIYIKDNFRDNFINNNEIGIEVKSTGDYQSSLAEMMLSRYLKIASIYNEISNSEEELINYIDNTLQNRSEIETISKLNTEKLNKATVYYNFTNYCFLAGCIYVICLVLSSFKNRNIKMRTIISSMNYKKYNRKLLISCSMFDIILWLLYVLLSFILVGNIMYTTHGLLYIINALIFTFFALTFAFLLGNILKNKTIINGIINVVALGSSFLCGAFVPMEWLPNYVINIAHILPSYYFIKNNELIKTIEVFNFDNIKPIIINMIIVIIFSGLFIIITNMITSKQRKID